MEWAEGTKEDDSVKTYEIKILSAFWRHLTAIGKCYSRFRKSKTNSSTYPAGVTLILSQACICVQTPNTKTSGTTRVLTARMVMLVPSFIVLPKGKKVRTKRRGRVAVSGGVSKTRPNLCSSKFELWPGLLHLPHHFSHARNIERKQNNLCLVKVRIYNPP